ncbi:unnamed protein product [Pleuronectes platessa]|uniref:Uncharacterized protein n=1 Tax=Pleuronectes platessa TaxID=8262 RepID=A0A9N7YTD1_PLEPL|nr:unnamed protein product [Pleuronectes platessa]
MPLCDVFWGWDKVHGDESVVAPGGQNCAHPAQPDSDCVATLTKCICPHPNDSSSTGRREGRKEEEVERKHVLFCAPVTQGADERVWSRTRPHLGEPENLELSRSLQNLKSS